MKESIRLLQPTMEKELFLTSISPTRLKCRTIVIFAYQLMLLLLLLLTATLHTQFESI